MRRGAVRWEEYVSHALNLLSDVWLGALLMKIDARLVLILVYIF